MGLEFINYRLINYREDACKVYLNESKVNAELRNQFDIEVDANMVIITDSKLKKVKCC